MALLRVSVKFLPRRSSRRRVLYNDCYTKLLEILIYSHLRIFRLSPTEFRSCKIRKITQLSADTKSYEVVLPDPKAKMVRMVVFTTFFPLMYLHNLHMRTFSSQKKHTMYIFNRKIFRIWHQGWHNFLFLAGKGSSRR